MSVGTETRLVNQTFVENLSTTEIALAQQTEKEQELQKLRIRIIKEKEKPAHFREAVSDYLKRKFPFATKYKDINIESIPEKELRRIVICAKRYFGLKASIVPSVAIVSCSLLVWSFVDVATYCSPSSCSFIVMLEVMLKTLAGGICGLVAYILDDVSIAPFCDSFRKYFVLKNYLKNFSKNSKK